ncbi:MAG: APC family permease [Thaumarchaeota archaeon]|nr:APC family permease [Nitrososphaerota archaeon]
MQTKQTKQFVRDATGLVREYGAMDTLLFASVFVFALVFTITQFAWFYGNTLGADLTGSLLLAAIPFAFLMLTYWAIGVLMPRTGNDYVFVGRILHPSIGFTWGLVYVLIVFLAAFIGAGTGPLSFAVSSIVSVAGLLGNSASMTNLGAFLGGPQGTLEVMILLTAVVAAFTIFGSKLIKAFLYTTWVFAIVGMIIMWYILSTTSNATFQANWNNLIAQGSSNYTYAGLQNAASSNASFTPAVGFAGIIAALPLAFLFLFGGNYANAFAGEIKNVRKSLPIALFLSLILGLGYWILTSTLTANTVGFNWITAVGHGWTSGGSSTGVPSYPLPYQPTQPLFLAVAAYPNTFLIDIMFFTYIIGSLGPVFAYFWIPSKYLFAWSFDRVIPSKFADVSSRFHTAWVAVLATAVIGIVGEYLYSILGYSSYFSMGTVLWGISYTIPGLALTIFPFVKKDLFAGAPGWMGKKVAGIPLLSVVGLITTIGFALVGYIAFTSAVVNSVPVNVTAEVSGATIIAGFAIYFASRSYHKRQGLDVSMALKEIPPE